MQMYYLPRRILFDTVTQKKKTTMMLQLERNKILSVH